MTNKFTTTFLAAASLVGTLSLATPADAEETPVQAKRVEVGQQAPKVSLLSSTGEMHNSDTLRDEKDLVLIFFRGSW